MKTDTLPWSEKAETETLGALLFRGDRFPMIADLLTPADFYDAKHEAIFAAMLALHADHVPIDLLTVAERLHALGQMKRLLAVNSEAYLAELASLSGGGEPLEQYAEILRGYSDRRKFVMLGSQMMDAGGRLDVDFDRAFETANTGLLEIGMRQSVEAVRSLGSGIQEFTLDLEKKYKAQKAVTGIPTGFEPLDEMTCGLHDGQMVVVAARPGMGKTSLMLQFALHATDDGYPAIVFSAEMSRKSLTGRVMSIRSGVDASALRTGQLIAHDWAKLTKAGASLYKLPFDVDDTGAPLLKDIRAKCRRWRADKKRFGPGVKTGLILVDYLQLVHAPGANRQEQVGNISRGLRAIAKELNVALVALAQLNRLSDSRTDKRPMLSELKESGSIEQDADTVMLIYRDDYYNKASKTPGVAEIIIPKQREGETGTVELGWDGAHTRFKARPDRVAPPRTWHDEDRP